ncbi:MAG TPA: alpha/beta hydrolase [Solirubrobacterales bacterium]
MSARGQRLLTAAERAAARYLFRNPTDLPLPWALKRRWTEVVATANLVPGGLRRASGRIDGVRAERLEPEAGATGGVLLYLHGGGYVQGSPRVQRVIAGRLALAGGATSFAPDYRLAPEHGFPAAFDDCLAVYLALAERHGAGNVAIAGDSAGGGLSLAVALAARDLGRSPAGLFLICPWVDLAADRSRGPSTDPILSRKLLVDGADAYVGAGDRTDPRCSPLHGDLAGLPPILVHTAAEDPLLPDAEALAGRAAAAGAEIELVRFPLWHDFHVHAGILDVADAAIEQAGAFIRERLRAKP